MYISVSKVKISVSAINELSVDLVKSYGVETKLHSTECIGLYYLTRVLIRPLADGFAPIAAPLA